MTNKEARKAAYAADPTLRERERQDRARELELLDQARSARYLLALAEQAERAGEAGPAIDILVASPSGIGRASLAIRVRVERLGAGARECLRAGLRSLNNADDASRLLVLTGLTVGEERLEKNAHLRAIGEEYLRAYGHTEGLDDATPVVVRVVHSGLWRPEHETVEGYLDAVLGRYAGRVVAAGLLRPEIEATL